MRHDYVERAARFLPSCFLLKSWDYLIDFCKELFRRGNKEHNARRANTQLNPQSLKNKCLLYFRLYNALSCHEASYIVQKHSAISQSRLNKKS